MIVPIQTKPICPACTERASDCDVPHPLSDAALVQRMQQGDMTAFDLLYARYQNEAYRVACLITGSREDGEDVTQDAFLRCAQSIRSLRDGSRFRPWLLTTLTRAAWRACRRRRRETPVEQIFDCPQTEGESALAAALRADEVARLYTALGALRPKLRAAVVLYYFEELSVAQTAQVLGVREGTVKSRLHAARAALRQALDEKTI